MSIYKTGLERDLEIKFTIYMCQNTGLSWARIVTEGVVKGARYIEQHITYHRGYKMYGSFWCTFIVYEKLIIYDEF